MQQSNNKIKNIDLINTTIIAYNNVNENIDKNGTVKKILLDIINRLLKLIKGNGNRI